MAQAQAAFDFSEVGRLPAPDDNVAIATRRLEAGTLITYEGAEFALDYTVLEGHRFAIKPIALGEPLLSWGLHFGYALKWIAPGTGEINYPFLLAHLDRIGYNGYVALEYGPLGTTEESLGWIKEYGLTL